MSFINALQYIHTEKFTEKALGKSREVVIGVERIKYKNINDQALQ